MIEGLETFLNQYRQTSNDNWLAGLIENQWFAVDWPAEYGGPDVTRQQKLNLVKELAHAGCPLWPESVTVIAPLLLNLGSEKEKQTSLPSILVSPQDWLLEIEDATLVIQHGSQRIRLGGPGDSDMHLATCVSPLFQIHSLVTSLARIDDMTSHWGEEADSDVTELNILLSSLEVMYLQDDPRKDLQIALMTNRAEFQSYSLLFQLLGYYALLDPDPVQTDNEYIPFSKERDHLCRLRRHVGRNDMVQQDRLYEEYLD
ncbi:MAG: hypothetical protein HOC70_13460 [Gammaproteobacteria bacterium]|nr:hypothetical protein [Gammaproteobacteria bacterium]MBT4494243.1 hypothetical protein [Gammaproteobacteria bacterium]